MKHKVVLPTFLIGCTLLILFMRHHPWFPTLLITILFLFSIIVSVGVIYLSWSYFIPVRSRTKHPYVLLTFDDGPGPLTPQILDILQQEHVSALFFLVGEQAQQNPEIVRRMIREGHAIGNHTQSHLNFFALSPGNIVSREIREGAETLRTISGEQQLPFRPPIGYTNPIIARKLKKNNTPVIGWSLRTFDTLRKNPENLLRHLVHKTKPGMIILLHDTQPSTVAILETYIREARKNGIIFAGSEQLKAFIHEIYTHSL